MFRRLADARGDTVSISVDGKALTARAGDSVAAALLAAGVLVCRTSAVSEAPRAPYCLMGVCFECLLAIDGRQNRQACLVQVAEGMRIETQAGKREVGR